LDRQRYDGLNTLRYQLKSREETPLFTKYVVYYDQNEYQGEIDSLADTYGEK
jgi:hypothetical protein